MKRLLAVAASAFVVFASPALGAPRQGDVIIRHVSVVDVERATTIAKQAVVLQGGDIVAVGADAVVAKDWRAKRTVEGKGRYLIPGLWDMHVHFGGGPELVDENKALLPLYVANGITTIRDCIGRPCGSGAGVARRDCRRARCSGRAC
jgi:imidazolonepropionase-like amidohydrolase